MTVFEQVVITYSGMLTTVIPLHATYYDNDMALPQGYSIYVSNQKALAYLVYCGDNIDMQIISADTVHQQCEFLGDL